MKKSIDALVHVLVISYDLEFSFLRDWNEKLPLTRRVLSAPLRIRATSKKAQRASFFHSCHSFTPHRHRRCVSAKRLHALLPRCLFPAPSPFHSTTKSILSPRGKTLTLLTFLSPSQHHLQNPFRRSTDPVTLPNLSQTSTPIGDSPSRNPSGRSRPHQATTHERGL